MATAHYSVVHRLARAWWMLWPHALHRCGLVIEMLLRLRLVVTSWRTGLFHIKILDLLFFRELTGVQVVHLMLVLLLLLLLVLKQLFVVVAAHFEAHDLLVVYLVSRSFEETWVGPRAVLPEERV